MDQCFTVDFLQFLLKKVKLCLLGGWLGAHPQIQAFQGFS